MTLERELARARWLFLVVVCAAVLIVSAVAVGLLPSWMAIAVTVVVSFLAALILLVVLYTWSKG